MSERRPLPEAIEVRETIEQRRDRLRPALLRSQEVFRNPEKPLRDGMITLQVEQAGERKTMSGLVALEVADDAVEFGTIEDDGDIGSSGSLAWEDIVDVK